MSTRLAKAPAFGERRGSRLITAAIIGGTGVGDARRVPGAGGYRPLPGMEVVGERGGETGWGEASHPVLECRLGGEGVYFLARHGVPRRLAPHAVNYRANIAALRALGARRAVAVNAVGGINPACAPGRLVIPDQLIDYTWGRAHTFHDDALRDDFPRHIDFTEPYDPGIRRQLAAIARRQHLDCVFAGTYAATQGPRLETAAEVRRLAKDGCDMAGMTGMPEAALAREAGIRYASVCIVVNWAAGIGDEPITEAAAGAVLRDGVAAVGSLLAAWLKEPAAG